MKTKVLLILVVVLLMFSGCQQNQKPEWQNEIAPVNNRWESRYGDSYESQLAYNVALLLRIARDHELKINGQDSNETK